MEFARCVALGLTLLSRLAGAGGSPDMDRDAASQLIDVQHFQAGLLAQEVFRETNAIRAREGLAALKPEARLAAAASEQAAVLALRIHSGHDNPLAHHGDPYARVLQEGLPAGQVGENAATLGTRDSATNRTYTYREMAAVIVQAWMDSPGHRANLLSPAFHYLGCGTRAAYLLRDNPVVYAIQDFYTPSLRHDPLESDMPGGGHLTR